MTRLWKIRVIVAAALAALVGVGAGATLSLQNDPGEVRTDLVDYAQNDRVRESTLRGTPSAMLEDILQRAKAEHVIASTIGGPPSSFRGAEEGLPVPSRLSEGVWVYSTVAAAASGAASLRAVWEADLVAGALRDGVHRLGRDVVGNEISVQLPSGKVLQHSYGGMGDVTYAQDFANPSSDQLEADIRAALSDSNLELHTFETVAADQIAPAIVVVTTEPERAVRNLHLIVNGAFGLPPMYEGYYIEIRDSKGEAAVIQAASFRTGVGRRWTRPDLDTRLDPGSGLATQQICPYCSSSEDLCERKT